VTSGGGTSPFYDANQTAFSATPLPADLYESMAQPQQQAQNATPVYTPPVPTTLGKRHPAANQRSSACTYFPFVPRVHLCRTG